MSGSGVRLQMPDVLSSVQLKNLELKSLTSFKLKHAKKQKQRMFEKTEFTGSGSGLGGSGPSGGCP